MSVRGDGDLQKCRIAYSNITGSKMRYILAYLDVGEDGPCRYVKVTGQQGNSFDDFEGNRYRMDLELRFGQKLAGRGLRPKTSSSSMLTTKYAAEPDKRKGLGTELKEVLAPSESE